MTNCVLLWKDIAAPFRTSNFQHMTASIMRTVGSKYAAKQMQSYWIRAHILFEDDRIGRKLEIRGRHSTFTFFRNDSFRFILIHGTAMRGIDCYSESNSKNRTMKWITKCGNCQGDVVAAAGRLWHTRHFQCTECQIPLPNREYYTSGNNVICLDCHLDDINLKCGECNRTLYEEYLSVSGQNLHHDCFLCTRCRNPMPGRQYLIYEGKWYDEDCYHRVKYQIDSLRFQ
ncbi:LIM domain protein [Dictyocaulus viviparus]|uniref:LIM domain protein n=1 Tax=Dictyocaulus viviparus TaxID=29172 RepID=A0A0D8Y4C0_DICVI|nr:LIM domain protein [Dictyocaulus viviparus]